MTIDVGILPSNNEIGINTCDSRRCMNIKILTLTLEAFTLRSGNMHHNFNKDMAVGRARNNPRDRVAVADSRYIAKSVYIENVTVIRVVTNIIRSIILKGIQCLRIVFSSF